MRVSGSYTWSDSESIELAFEDEQENFDPIRLKDLAAELRTTLRLILADAAHERTEHQPPP